MNQRLPAILSLIFLLSACASIDGIYLPACEAYSGSEIRLADGRFRWSKFTDQVVVDDDGNTVDPFPGFPLEGKYRIQEQTVTLTSDTGQPAETLYLLEEGGAIYLLTAREKAAMEADGARPKCALRRQSSGT